MERLLVCLFIFSSFIISVHSQSCPYGWGTKRYSQTWPCYLFTNKIQRTWALAQTFCEDMGGSLLKIETVQERDWVFKILKYYTGYYPSHTEWWIGLHDKVGQIAWTDGSIPQPNLLPWVSGEPGSYDHSKACVEYNNGSIQHETCNNQQYFVCKRPRESAIWCDALHGWESINQMCYKFVSKLRTWDDARGECQKEDGDLVVAADDNTQDVLFRFIESRKANVWIGLKAFQYTNGSAYFSWYSKDGKKLDTLHAHFNSPTYLTDVVSSNFNKTCTFANYSLHYPNLWQTSDCGERRFSLCQKPEGRCSAGWVENQFTCYLFLGRPKLSWMAAKNYCEQRGATLLHIQSPNEQSFINNNLGAFKSRGVGGVWLGLSASNGGRWTWADNSVFAVNSPYIYNNLNGQNITSGPGLKCLTIYTDDVNGTWQVANDCMSNKSFVCQIPAQQPPRIPTTPAPTGTAASVIPASPTPTAGTAASVIPASPTPTAGTAASVIPASPTPTVTWSSDCGPFWIKDSKTGYCYKFSEDAMTWFQARHSCEGQGSQLTSINSYYEETFLTDFVYGFKSVALWIGVNDLHSGGGYNWIDGTGFGYINWAPGEPNNVHDNEHCAEFVVAGDKSGMWNDINCNEKRGYICKKKATDFSTMPPSTTPAVPAGQIYGCPDSSWLGYGNNCFLIKKTNSTWINARKYCEGQGWNLASISNQNEQNFVFSQLPPNTGYRYRDQYWIGLNDLQIQMIFRWTDGSPVTYTQWDNNEPNNYQDRREDCVTMIHEDGYWNDNSCIREEAGFICKTPKSVLPNTVKQADLSTGCSVKGSIGYGYDCYQINAGPQTWDDANLDCQHFGGALASIHNKYQQAFLASQIAVQSSMYYWIGLSDKLQPGTLQWIDGKPLDFTAWSANHTGNNASICISMRNGGIVSGLWVDQTCLTRQPYICQYPRTGFSTPKISTTTTLAPPTCPAGWFDYNGYCYKFYKGDADIQTWFGARDSCRAIGADLVSIHSRDEMNRVFSYKNLGYVYQASYWIGLNDFGIEKSYVWTDGSPVNYTSWGTGEPNDADGTDDCVEFNRRGNTWNDNNCYIAKKYVCKIKKGQKVHTASPTMATFPPGNCGSLVGWKLFNGSCYYTSDKIGSNSRRTWFGARDFCNKQGAELVSIHSVEENNFLVTLLSLTTKSDSWLGLHDVGQNRFIWSDGTFLDYTKWQGNEPNDAFGSEKCGQIQQYNGYWNDNDCNENYHFVCKKAVGSNVPITQAPTLLTPGACPAGYTGINNGNKCFKIVGARTTTDRKDYQKAKDDCRSNGPLYDIASLNSYTEIATVVSMLNGLILDDSDVWIGLNDQNNNRRFTWQDSVPLLITNWDKGQPSRYGGKCVAMSSDSRHAGKWHNLRCSNTRPYVCETYRNSSLPTTTAIPSCQRSGYVSNGLDCYKVHRELKTFTQASMICQGEKAQLTSVSSVYEQAYIDTLTGDINSPLWIGLRDPQNTGTYSWLDNTPVVYTSWNQGEPTYQIGEACVSMNKGLWNDTMCHMMYPFVCKVLFFTPPPPTGYPSGFCKDITWRQYGDFCYYVSLGSPRKTWTQANQDCIDRGMQLVSITDKLEENFVLNELDHSSLTSVDLWIGFKRTNGYFQWTDGTQVSYINWENNPGSQDCVLMQKTSGKWKVGDCDSTLGHVCKTPKLPATSPTTPSTTMSTKSSLSSAAAAAATSHGLPTLFPPATQASGSPSQQPSQTANTGTKGGNTVTQTRVTKSGQPVTAPLKQQQQYIKSVDTDLSGGQIAGIIVGVVLVLFIACGLLFILKRRLGTSMFKFAQFGNSSDGAGFDNAAYDKQMESVKIKSDSTNISNGHGMTLADNTDANMEADA